MSINAAKGVEISVLMHRKWNNNDEMRISKRLIFLTNNNGWCFVELLLI